MDIAFLIIRLVLGLAIAAHGAQKAFGWFGGPGLKGATGFMQMLGFRPPAFFALAASATEIAAGILTVLGLGGPIGPALIVLVMVVAIATVHAPNGFFAAKNGFELNVMYMLSAASVAFAGYNGYGLDSVIGLNLSSPLYATIALATGAVLGLLNASLRSKQPAASAN